LGRVTGSLRRRYGKDAVYAAIELSKKTWVVAILRPGTVQPSLHRIKGGSSAELVMRLRAASNDERLFVCYEAGYDGFWLARSLAAEGVDCRVLDPASLQVNRRARRVKTGRIDVLMLVWALITIDRGDGHVCAIVNVPTLPSGTSAIDPRAHRPYQPHQGPSLRAGRFRRRTCSTQTYRFFGPAHRRRPPAGAAAKKFWHSLGVKASSAMRMASHKSEIVRAAAPQQGPELGERHFDGAEVRRVGREIHQRRTGRFDGLPNAKLPNQH
jgi:hypothetical protein